jgi:hypothetical protein
MTGLVLFPLLTYYIGRKLIIINSVYIPLVFLATSLFIAVSKKDDAWFVVMLVVAWIMWSTDIIMRKGGVWQKSEITNLSLLVMLFVLPFAYSWGTNMPLLLHSKMAGIFYISSLLLLLYGAQNNKLINNLAFYSSLSFLCIPSVAGQYLQWSDVAYTYRLNAPLSEQNIPIRLDSGVNIKVDSETYRNLEDYKKSMSSGGFKAGMSIMDFTGDGPGLIYSVGGRPVGVAWLLGGYKGSEANTMQLFKKLNASNLEKAWILTSDDNPRRIKNWRESLSQKVDPKKHVLYKQIYFHSAYGWKGMEKKDYIIKIWRPVNIAEN